MTARTLLTALPATLNPVRIAGNGTATRRPLQQLVSDSRSAKEGALFVAIRGARSDGHDYLAAAYGQGCRCFLVETPPTPPLPPDADVWLVPDTRCALAYLAAAFYGHPAKKMTLLGITGTKGKTTTALLAYGLLQLLGEPVGYIGTEGVWYAEYREPTQNTTPDPLTLHRTLRHMRESGVRTVVLEVSSQSVLQHRIDGLHFAAAAFTNLAPDHISPTEHPTFEHYRDCKRDFLRDGVTHRSTLLVNADDLHAAYMSKDSPARIVTYGIDSAADLRATALLPTMNDGTPGVSFACGGMAAMLPMAGAYNVSNALCAVGMLRALGYPLARTLPLLRSLYVPGRLQPLPAPTGSAILVDYAHNGISLSSVLQTLRPYATGRLICLVGSVGGRTQMRRADLGDAAAQYADLTVLTADNPDFEDPRAICEEMARSFTARGQDNYLIIPDRAEAIRRAASMLREGDVLLLAGKGSEDYQLVQGERVPFSERDIVTEAVKQALYV